MFLKCRCSVPWLRVGVFLWHWKEGVVLGFFGILFSDSPSFLWPFRSTTTSNTYLFETQTSTTSPGESIKWVRGCKRYETKSFVGLDTCQNGFCDCSSGLLISLGHSPGVVNRPYPVLGSKGVPWTLTRQSSLTTRIQRCLERLQIRQWFL